MAQKYGTYQDEDGTDWNHASGIIFTPHPFLLTVMTRYGGISETIIGDLAALFCDYTILADSRLTAEPPEKTKTSESILSDTLTLDTVQRTEDTTLAQLMPETADDEDRSGNSGRENPQNPATYEGTEQGEQAALSETESTYGRLAVIAAALGIELILSLSLVLMRLLHDGRRNRRRK